eukprot:g3940.t1
MSDTLALLGDVLRKPDGTIVPTSQALKGKEVLGLYFSAHWCPPCKGFTPKLSDNYKKLVDAKKKIEIVFVSSDKDEDAFKGYHKEMPFLALPFENRKAQAKLSRLHKVRGIPTLVFVEANTGKLITADGREEMSEPDFIERYPYRSAPVDVLKELGDTLVVKGKPVAAKSLLEGKKVLGLYFSAHWCGPCRMFTPTLCAKYTKLKEAGKSFELVFVSSDQDEDAFLEYHKEQNFPALPYKLRDAKSKLSKHFNVEGIPTLVFIDAATGALITDEGRGGITSESFVEDFPYHPKSVNDLAGSLAGINDNPSLVVLMENASEDVQKATTDMLTEFAEKELKSTSPRASKFFTGKTTQDCPLTKIKNACGYKGADGSVPRLLLLDLGDEGAYYHPEKGKEAVTPENLEAFLAAFQAEKLTKKQFGS